VRAVDAEGGAREHGERHAVLGARVAVEHLHTGHDGGDAESSLGDAESSLGDAKSSLGDAESSLGDVKSSLGDVKSSLGDATSL
jgi:hypothetical protein